jgi:hypothetical protein
VTDNTYSLASQLDADQYDAEFRLKQQIAELVNSLRDLLSAYEEVIESEFATIRNPHPELEDSQAISARNILAKYEAK